MTDEQKKQFFKQQSKTVSGQQWLELLKEMVASLYHSKGKTPDQVVLDQRAAEMIETKLINPVLYADQALQPQKNKEYI